MGKRFRRWPSKTIAGEIMTRRFKQFGYSLPEILVALASSSLLITTLMSQYVGLKQHYKRSASLLEKALDAQLVVDLMRDSIRQAGFTPCLGVEHLSTIDMRSQKRGLTAIDLHSGDAAGFQVNHMSNQYGLFIKQVSLTDLIVTKEAALSLQHPVIIADCYHAEVHSIEHLRSVSGNWEIGLNHAMFYSYQPPIYIGEWLEEGFFMKSDTLFYSLGHADALSSAIHDASVSLKTRHGKRLVHVALAMDKGRLIKVDTMVRVA
jgi:hypothetical protein